MRLKLRWLRVGGRSSGLTIRIALAASAAIRMVSYECRFTARVLVFEPWGEWTSAPAFREHVLVLRVAKDERMLAGALGSNELEAERAGIDGP